MQRDHNWFFDSFRESKELMVGSLDTSPEKTEFMLNVNDVRVLQVDTSN
jgi:hypothetical protein